MPQISIELASEWLTIIDQMAKDHVYGAKNRQDVIRALLAEQIKKKEKEQ